MITVIVAIILVFVSYLSLATYYKWLARLDSDRKDAARYRMLRESHWNDCCGMRLCVTYVANVKTGGYCPSMFALDAALDACARNIKNDRKVG